MTEQETARSFDFFKHMTTMNFAAIGVLIVIVDKGLAAVPQGGLRVPLACFGVSVMCSRLMLIDGITPKTTKPASAFRRTYHVWITIGCAICAMLTFALGVG